MQYRLVADIGGTNIRLGFSSNGEVLSEQVSRCDSHASLEDAIAAFLSGVPHPATMAAIAVAAPVAPGGVVRMTNRPWQFSADALKSRFGFARVAILNDFAALALSLPHLSAKDVAAVQEGKPAAGAPRLVLGSGTGLGMAGLVPAPSGVFIPVATEGGHVALAVETDEEYAALALIRKRHGRVSAERILSGPGLCALADALASVRGKGEVAPASSEAIVAGMRRGDAFCSEVMSVFAGWLGAFVGDMALAWGARGGVFLGGGLLSGLGPEFLEASPFCARFAAKGRFGDYLRQVPVFLITRANPAFPGLSLTPEGGFGGMEQ